MKVVFYKRILTGGGYSSRDPIFKREFDLPFPPFKGLMLLDGEGNEYKVASDPAWIVERQEFEVHDEDVKAYLAKSVEDIVSDLVEAGWMPHRN